MPQITSRVDVGSDQFDMRRAGMLALVD